MQKFVSENFSFASPDAEAAYVYFGSDGKVAMWEVVDNICSNSDGRKEYITSTEAGKLFNDDGFNETLRKYSNNNGLLKNTNGIQELYEGTNSSGEISFYNNGKEIKVKAFNDYFLEEYIRNIRCSEVKTIFTGDYLAKNGIGNNAFCRTELNLLLGDNCIETINEIDKNIIKEIMAVAIKLYRNGDNLILKNKTNNDKITISQAYAGNSGDYCVGKIEFANIALYEIDYTNVSVELIESYEPVSETGTVVDSMVNLVVQEMSETTASNIIDISRMAEDTSTSDTIQLWEAK